MTTKDYVKQIKKIDTLIRNKSVDIKQAEKLGVDASYIKNSVKQLQNTRSEIMANIEALSEAEYDVLHRVYVQGQTLQEVAYDRDITYRCVASIHGRALKTLEQLIKSE